MSESKLLVENEFINQINKTKASGKITNEHNTLIFNEKGVDTSIYFKNKYT